MIYRIGSALCVVAIIGFLFVAFGSARAEGPMPPAMPDAFSWWNVATAAIGAAVGMFWRKLTSLENNLHQLALTVSNAQLDAEKRFAKQSDIEAVRDEILRHLKRIEDKLGCARP